jgi:hypothetical protein
MKNTILKTILYSSILIITLMISSFTLQNVIGKQEKKKVSNKTTNSGFAVLELFTSQGCSSCPPADIVLGKYALQNNPNIFPLAFHVDYWNYIGWKDPFSKAQFSQRQNNYANIMNSQGNYTPQLIINGQHELVGSKESAIKEIVNEELAIKKQYTIVINKAIFNTNTITVEYNLDKTPSNTIINLALVKKEEFTSIKRGENNGLKQTNYNIVYDFKTVSSSSNNETFEFKKEWITSDFLIVAYLQNSESGKVLTASKSEIK